MLTDLYYWNFDLWNIWIVRTVLGNSVEMAVMRRRRYLMKTVLIFLGIVLCFLYISSTSQQAGIGDDNSKFYKERRSDNVKHNGQPIPNEQNIRTVAGHILIVIPEHINNSIPNKPSVDKNQEIVHVQKTINSSINSEQDSIKNISKHSLKQTILEVNRKQEIRNLERFPTRPPNAPVLVVMVHKRLEYLRFLIDSFREAKDISETLLIFSHDFYSEDINALIKQIDFCQTMQIFYPYLLQIYENEFPGVDPNDCPRNVDRKKAKQLKCNNAEHPDKYGHYREVKFVMTKHHWWWKLQHVFTGITSLHNHTGPVLLLEEDHYVSPDFIPVLRQMYGIKQSKCPECDILTIGTYDKSPRYRDRANKVDVLNWQSSKHNMGMSIDRATWQRLQPCAEEFCRFDDYNWDWTLQHISTACLKPPLGVMVPKSPRIFHIGECGIHHKGKCNADDLVKKINNILNTNSEFLFPDNLQMTPKTRPIRSREPKANGGWGDIRDHTLCITYGRTQS